jgi:hypothetical protein
LFDLSSNLVRLVRSSQWVYFDKDALCVAAIADTMAEQKQHESFEAFKDRVAAVARFVLRIPTLRMEYFNGRHIASAAR